MPNQPAFHAHASAGQVNIAVASQVTVVVETERFDNGNNFASNTFTAPVTGKYQLNAEVRLQDLDTAGSSYTLRINTSNVNYDISFDPSQYVADITGSVAIGKSVLVDMDANDSASIEVRQSAGTQQTDIKDTHSRFSGFLVA